MNTKNMTVLRPEYQSIVLIPLISKRRPSWGRNAGLSFLEGDFVSSYFGILPHNNSPIKFEISTQPKKGFVKIIFSNDRKHFSAHYETKPKHFECSTYSTFEQFLDTHFPPEFSKPNRSNDQECVFKATVQCVFYIKCSKHSKHKFQGRYSTQLSVSE